MNRKVTLSMDPNLIQAAKKYAAKSGKSLSQIVAEYLQALVRKEKNNDDENLPPTVRSLKGVLKNKNVEEDDYQKYLEEKYL